MSPRLSRFMDHVKSWAGNHHVRRYAANMGWMMGTRAAWVLSAFTVGIYVARKLGPYRFGELNFAIALTGIFSIIATMSVEEIVIRQLVKEPEHTPRILANFFVFRLILFLIMAGVLGITLFLLRLPSETKHLCLIIGAGYASYLAQGSVLYFQARVKSKYAAIPQLLACLINSLLRLIAAYLDWPLAMFALAESCNLAIYYFGSMYLFWRRENIPWTWEWDWTELRGLLKSALPLAICSVFSLVYARTDQLMVGYYLGPEAVGYYSLATRITENWAIAANLMCLSFFPAVVTAAQMTAGAYQKQLHRLYFLVFWSMAGAAFLTILLSRPVISLLFGLAYLPAVPVLKVFVCTLLGTALLNVFALWAINEHRLALIFWSFASGATINIVMNPIMIHWIGIKGAAWSSLISMPLGLTLALNCCYEGKKHFRLLVRSILSLPSFTLGQHD